MRTIQEQWESYRRCVLPPNCSEVQISECRNAFYAGVQAMLFCTLEISKAEVSEAAGVQILEGYHDELRRFIEAIT